MAKNYKYGPRQIGGIRERVATAMLRTKALTEDEIDIIDLMANPAVFGKDKHGSHKRLREAFERILEDASLEAEKCRKILSTFN
jgi:hypothetical protein